MRTVALVTGTRTTFSNCISYSFRTLKGYRNLTSALSFVLQTMEPLGNKTRRQLVTIIPDRLKKIDTPRLETLKTNLQSRGKSHANVFVLYIVTQPEHDISTTLYGRCYDIKTRKRRRYNVVLTSCAG